MKANLCYSCMLITQAEYVVMQVYCRHVLATSGTLHCMLGWHQGLLHEETHSILNLQHYFLIYKDYRPSSKRVRICLVNQTVVLYCGRREHMSTIWDTLQHGSRRAAQVAALSSSPHFHLGTTRCTSCGHSAE